MWKIIHLVLFEMFSSVDYHILRNWLTICAKLMVNKLLRICLLYFNQNIAQVRNLYNQCFCWSLVRYTKTDFF